MGRRGGWPAAEHHTADFARRKRPCRAFLPHQALARPFIFPLLPEPLSFALFRLLDKHSGLDLYKGDLVHTPAEASSYAHVVPKRPELQDKPEQKVQAEEGGVDVIKPGGRWSKRESCQHRQNRTDADEWNGVG